MTHLLGLMSVKRSKDCTLGGSLGLRVVYRVDNDRKTEDIREQNELLDFRE
jgi:hypothetical protein